MKKILLSLTIAVMFVGTVVIPVNAAESTIPKNTVINVLMDGKKIKFQGGNPYSDSASRIQVPFRGIGEAMGAKVDYSGKIVSFEKGDISIQLTLGSNIAAVNGKTITLDSVATAKNGRTFVPLRFISENLGENVRWDGEGNMVWIGEEKFYTQEEIAGAGEDISKYASLYEGKEYLMSSASGIPYTKIHVLSLDQFPVKIGPRIIYDMWTYEENGKEYIAIRHSHTSPNIYFLTDTLTPKFRYPWDKDSNKKEIKTDSYAVMDYADRLYGDNNPEEFKIRQTKYIGFRIDSASIVLLKNPWE